jgi:RES domain-containing protein
LIPPIRSIRQHDTHRLIPSRYSDEGALRRLTDNENDFEALLELEGATNERLLGAANRLPGISVHELLFGVEHADIVNAAFTHAHPAGSRFNDASRGAWYAAFELKTATAEVAFHKAEELREIEWREPEMFELTEYLADFAGGFHDLRGEGFANVLSPTSYSASQTLARNLLSAGSAGIVYPSVRRSKGTCLVCFRPALVTNVRQGQTVTLKFKTWKSSPVVSASF